MRVLTTKLRVEIENEMRVFLESLNFEIEMRVSQKSDCNGDVKGGLNASLALVLSPRVSCGFSYDPNHCVHIPFLSGLKSAQNVKSCLLRSRGVPRHPYC